MKKPFNFDRSRRVFSSLQLVPLLQRAVSIVFGEGHEDEHDVMHVCHSSVHIVLLDKVIKVISAS